MVMMGEAKVVLVATAAAVPVIERTGVRMVLFQAVATQAETAVAIWMAAKDTVSLAQGFVVASARTAVLDPLTNRIH